MLIEPPQTQSQRAARVIVLGIALFFTGSLLYLSVVCIRELFEDTWKEAPLRHWRYLAGAVAALFGSFVCGSGIYPTWRSLWTTSHHDIAGQRERRGSPILGTLRDDDFERQLNWLRDHKKLVKVIEGIAIAVLALIALLFSISQR
jgi:hypothetical protein